MKNKKIQIIIIATLVLAGLVFVIYKSTRPKLTPEQKAYYDDKTLIHIGENQAPDKLQEGYKPTIVLNNTETLYSFVTNDQFQYLKQSLAEYIHKNISADVLSASVTNGIVTPLSGADFLFNLNVDDTDKSLKVKVHPVDYYTVDVFINDEKFIISPPHEEEDEPS